ncbi:MAG: helix-turn-helix transcriptional regulator [Phycisphaerae bacterium]
MNRKQPTTENGLLTTREAAQLIGCTEGTLEVWRCTKRYAIPHIRIGARMIRYRRAALEAWLESRTVSA